MPFSKLRGSGPFRCRGDSFLRDERSDQFNRSSTKAAVFHAGIAGADWATTPGGHASIWEHPKPFNESVLAFIARHR